ncbi:MAG: bifunctional nuclease domain-containing protein [bacterium]
MFGSLRFKSRSMAARVDVSAFKVDWSNIYGKPVVLLKELSGDRVCPIIVEDSQAQTIEVLLNQISEEPYKRPRLVSTLLKKLKVRGLRIELMRNHSHEILGQVTYNRGGANSFSLESSAGEAIELAVRCNLSISIAESLLAELNDDAESAEKHQDAIDLLKQKLQDAIESESYEEAARLRDMILELEGKKNWPLHPPLMPPPKGD